ncbi:MAG: Tat pathway signal protein, partial [Halobacterium sp.]
MPPAPSNSSRRAFLKAAVAAGSTAALAACAEIAPSDGPPSGASESKPDRQHAWNEYARTDQYGNVKLPRHQALLYVSLDADGPPSESDRQTVETAFSVLDDAYEWSSDGLLFSVGYSPAYFERYETPLPERVDLPHPEPLSPFEDPVFDTQDVLVHLASDRADVVLEAEHALTGQTDAANGVSVDAALTEVATVESRRTGFFGVGMPAARQDASGIPDTEPVPEESPLFMGFEAGFAGNQATEDYVTLDEGPFAGGTTKVVANLRQRLRDWYVEQNYDERVMELFSPGHAANGLVEGVGNNLGSDSGIDQFVDDVTEHAREYGRVGHAQKAARANRDEDGDVRLLRRHFEST